MSFHSSKFQPVFVPLLVHLCWVSFFLPFFLPPTPVFCPVYSCYLPKGFLGGSYLEGSSSRTVTLTDLFGALPFLGLYLSSLEKMNSNKPENETKTRSLICSFLYLMTLSLKVALQWFTHNKEDCPRQRGLCAYPPRNHGPCGHEGLQGAQGHSGAS